MPGASWSFYFWQPATRLNNAPMAGTTAQPSHEGPHKKETKTGSHHSEKYQRRTSHRETGGGGGMGEEDGLKKSCAMANAAQRKISMPLNHMKVALK